MATKFARILTFLCFAVFAVSPLAQAEETLSWSGCLAEARKNHPDLIFALENVNQEKAGRRITASGLYPQVSAGVDASTARSGSSGENADSYSYGVSATQLIFDGFKTTNNVKAAAENIKAAQEGYSFTSAEIRMNLRSAFINLLKAQELIKVAEEIVKIRKDNFDLINLRYKSGLEHKGALLTAEANLAQANFELSQARREVSFSQRQLNKELGRGDFRPMFVNADFVVKDSAPEKPDFEALVKNHPSLMQYLARVNSSAFNVKSAYSRFYPQLSGKAAANKTGDHWEPKNDQWNLGLSLTMPIFEGGLRVAQVAQAEAAYRQSEADLRSKKDALVVSLEESWAALQDAIETVIVKRKALDASDERSKIAQGQYSAGFIDFDNWIIIENDLVNAKKAFLEAEAGSLLAEAGWIKAKGETLEYAQ